MCPKRREVAGLPPEPPRAGVFLAVWKTEREVPGSARSRVPLTSTLSRGPGRRAGSGPCAWDGSACVLPEAEPRSGARLPPPHPGRRSCSQGPSPQAARCRAPVPLALRRGSESVSTAGTRPQAALRVQAGDGWASQWVQASAGPRPPHCTVAGWPCPPDPTAGRRDQSSGPRTLSPGRTGSAAWAELALGSRWGTAGASVHTPGRWAGSRPR